VDRSRDVETRHGVIRHSVSSATRHSDSSNRLPSTAHARTSRVAASSEMSNDHCPRPAHAHVAILALGSGADVGCEWLIAMISSPNSRAVRPREACPRSSSNVFDRTVRGPSKRTPEGGLGPRRPRTGRPSEGPPSLGGPVRGLAQHRVVELVRDLQAQEQYGGQGGTLLEYHVPHILGNRYSRLYGRTIAAIRREV